MARAVTRTFRIGGWVLVVAASGCADQQFTVQYAPDFAHSATRTVSVFGIFRDGRMSPEAWDQLSPRLSAPFGGRTCDTAYTEQLVASEPTLSAAVDDYTRANGVTDDLLEEFAASAAGDAVLLFSIAGRPPQPIAHTGTGNQPAPPSMATTGRRGGGMTRASTPRPATDQNAFEVSASLFSKRLHRSVAIVAMRYTGQSVDEALARFTAKLAAELPGVTCVNWRDDGHVDEQRIRDAISR